MNLLRTSLAAGFLAAAALTAAFFRTAGVAGLRRWSRRRTAGRSPSGNTDGMKTWPGLRRRFISRPIPGKLQAGIYLRIRPPASIVLTGLTRVPPIPAGSFFLRRWAKASSTVRKPARRM